MQIVSYVYFDKSDEKKRLNHLLESCSSEMQLRKEIAREFNLNSITAGQVFSRFKEEFIKKLNKN